VHNGRQIDAPFESIAPNLINGAFVTTEKYIQERPDVVERVVRAMNRSVTFAAEHPKEVRKAIPAFTSSPEVAEAIRLPALDAEVDRRSIELNAQLAQKYGIIKRAPSVDELVHTGG
jgi:NitT/TauT family transport system substrate-binding protein